MSCIIHCFALRFGNFTQKAFCAHWSCKVQFHLSSDCWTSYTSWTTFGSRWVRFMFHFTEIYMRAETCIPFYVHSMFFLFHLENNVYQGIGCVLASSCYEHLTSLKQSGTDCKLKLQSGTVYTHWHKKGNKWCIAAIMLWNCTIDISEINCSFNWSRLELFYVMQSVYMAWNLIFVLMLCNFAARSEWL